MSEDIRETLEKQRADISELAAQMKIIEQSNVITEHKELLARYNVAIKDLAARCEKLSALYTRAERTRGALAAENTGLKAALYDQYYSEKTKLAADRQKQLEVFFATEIAQDQNRLDMLEAAIAQRINSIRKELNAHADIGNEIFIALNNLESDAYTKIVETKIKLAESAKLTESENERFDRLKNEAINDEQVVELSKNKKKSIERIIGLNILNIVGIILIIIGVIAAGQFMYIRMGDVFRGVVLFVLGAIFLTAGEIMNRKRASFFSLGITAGGIGILYAALSVSYFVLGIMNMYTALAICVVVTAIAFLLSTRYNAQTLLAIALVGGYLPILSIGPEPTLLFSIMGYLVLLNLLALFVSFRKKWTVATFVGFGLNILGTIYVTTLVTSANPASERIVEIIYVAFAIVIYTAIPLIGTYVAKIGFRTSDIVLLALNTALGSIIMFVNINGAGWSDYLGLASALFAVLYFAIGYIIVRKFQGERLMSVLFYITGTTFFVLFVPFQFDSMWFSLGWIVQGTALAVYGIMRDRRYFKLSGFIIGSIGLGFFIFFDFTSWFAHTFLFRFSLLPNLMFSWQYLAVTAASVIIMAAFACKKTVYKNSQKAFKYCAAVNLWLYALFIISRLNTILSNSFPDANLDINYLTAALVCVATLKLAIIYPRIPVLFDTGMKVISICFSVIGISYLVILNIMASPVTAAMGAQPAGIIALATAILVVVGALGAFAVYDLTRRVTHRGIGGYLPITVATYIVVIFTINLIRAYGLSFSSFWISIAYVLTALLWTILGFVKRNALLRRFGLGLALLSVAKLFIIDLGTLAQGFRILSYFILGAILVAISYVYQYFNKRLEQSVPQEKQDDI